MLFARVFPEQGKRRTEGEKQIRESSERVVENSTAWFVFLGRCKTGPGAARRPTRVSARRNPTRVHACECVCVHTAVIVSLSWLVQRRSAEISATTQPPSRALRRWHGERRGLPSNADAELEQPHILLLLQAGSAQLAPGIHSRDWSRCAGRPQQPGQGPAPSQGPAAFWSCVTSGILLWRLG